MNTFTLQPLHTTARANCASLGARAVVWAISGDDFVVTMNANKALRSLQPAAQCPSRQRDKRS